ncbi:MAG: hypothetical protein RL077_3502 [Verrucomicrobiota bacterium]
MLPKGWQGNGGRGIRTSAMRRDPRLASLESETVVDRKMGAEKFQGPSTGNFSVANFSVEPPWIFSALSSRLRGGNGHGGFLHGLAQSGRPTFGLDFPG